MSIPRSQRHLLVRGGTLVTMDSERRVIPGDVLITDGRIVGVGDVGDIPRATRLIDASGMHVLPGLIQGHVHLGQTMFRGLAEERSLLPWLRQRIWPLEAAHTAESAHASSMVGAMDCLLSGTTTVQEIGLAREMDAVFQAIEDSGIRAVGGQCLMDTGDGVPGRLLGDGPSILDEAVTLAAEWEGKARGRITTALCPRFILSCSRELWEAIVDRARTSGEPVHTHLLENQEEEQEVREVMGAGQIEFLDQMGVLDLDLRIAHGVLLDEVRIEMLSGRPLGVVHCPSANAKLGSGVADLTGFRKHSNLSVGIGCDGAACNNNLDVLEELRLGALLQDLTRGPGQFGALAAFEMATIGGARAIGKEGDLGSLEAGKMGDVVVMDLGGPATRTAAAASVYSRIVYGAARDAVRWVVVDGEILVEAGRLEHLDEAALLARFEAEANALTGRAGIN